MSRAFKCGTLLAAARAVGASSALPLVLALLLLWKWGAGLCGCDADAAAWRRRPLTDSGSQQGEGAVAVLEKLGGSLDFHSAFSFCLLLNFAPLISALLVGADKPQVFLYLKKSGCEVSKQFT